MAENNNALSNRFAATMLEWFRQNGRELPWRGTKDPYPIWLSEIILQQTQVKQGWSYWQRFMEQWPTVELLAQASEDEVLRLWQGLGYYSRARNLHHAARQVVEMGGFPHTSKELKQLKGVGDYTAAAIASIAFGEPVAVVDGNVYRVLSRHFGISTPINTTEGKHEFALLAQELLPPSEPSDYNQAMMDFGATLCTPQSPRCAECPLQATCQALHDGNIAQLPVKEKKLKIRERHLTYIYIRCKGQTAIHRRGPGDIWQGLWEPASPPVPSQRGGAAFGESTPNLLGGGWGEARLLKQNVRHVLTHRILLADFYLLETDERPPLPADYIWIDERDIDQYAVPRLVEKLLNCL